ncbi:MAG TPA: hypothetical protein VMR70_08990 [Flavisolibacter sp.]|nr:hypothetical protein [Flavisolibacter sp.]
MNKLLTLLTAVIFAACAGKTNQSAKASYWQSLKDSFPLKNLQEFVIDSQLETSYKKATPFRNKTIDSVIRHGAYYLHSWQVRNAGFTEFTLLLDEGEHGRRILYFIFDAADSLRSVTQMANKAGEGGIIYETRSRAISKDSLLKTSTATTVWDLSQPAPPPKLDKSMGDSTFSYLHILNDGRVVEKQFAEKKQLNLD